MTGTVCIKLAVWCGGCGEGGMHFIGGRRCENRGGTGPPRRGGWQGTPGRKAGPKEIRGLGEELTAGHTRNAEAVGKVAFSELWPCLRTIVSAKEHLAMSGHFGWRWGCCWHRVHRGQRPCHTPYNAHPTPQQGMTQPQMSVARRLGNL